MHPNKLFTKTEQKTPQSAQMRTNNTANCSVQCQILAFNSNCAKCKCQLE